MISNIMSHANLIQKKKDDAIKRVMELSPEGTCLRLKVAAVIVDEEWNIISEGVNTSVEGTPTCEEEGFCLTNEEGRCYRTIHAEVNAILKTSRDLTNHSIVVSHEPCENCMKVIAQSKIKDIYFLKKYNNPLKHKLKLSGIVNTLEL